MPESALQHCTVTQIHSRHNIQITFFHMYYLFFFYSKNNHFSSVRTILQTHIIIIGKL